MCTSDKHSQNRAVVLSYTEWMQILSALSALSAQPGEAEAAAAEVLNQLAEHQVGPYDRLTDELRTQRRNFRDAILELDEKVAALPDAEGLVTAVTAAIREQVAAIVGGVLRDPQFVEFVRQIASQSQGRDAHDVQETAALLVELRELIALLSGAKQTDQHPAAAPAGPPSDPMLRGRTYNPAAGAQRQRVADHANARATRGSFKMSGR